VDNELEVIRDQMEETRASLANKLETLEAQVRETVQSASETVASTVENVKSTVESVTDTVSSVTESVSSVTEGLDPRPFVENNPWVALGAAVGVGFVAGLVAGGSSSTQTTAQPASAYVPPSPLSSSNGQTSSDSGGLFSANGPLGPALDQVKGLAIGTLMGYLREMVSTSLPEMWKSDVTGLLDNLTSQLGGKPIHHPDLTPKEPAPPASESQDQIRIPASESSWEGFAPTSERSARGNSGRSSRPLAGASN